MQIIGRIVLDLEVTKEKFERHQSLVTDFSFNATGLSAGFLKLYTMKSIDLPS